ncbi:MAG: MarR family transcriptional regulator [Verrucomicrobiota bacterium JB022]|nr:MarR family transcriptional regulator [Verrucomicrobiota bacterium JB022]
MASESTPDGARLYILLWRAFKSVEAVDRASIQQLGFRNMSDFAVLEIVYHKGPQPVNTIGRKVFLTSGSITTAVHRLERAGLVTRVSSPDDRRVVYVNLTDEGRRVIARAYEAHAAKLDEAFSVLDAKERLQMARLLRKAGLHAAAMNAEPKEE